MKVPQSPETKAILTIPHPTSLLIPIVPPKLSTWVASESSFSRGPRKHNWFSGQEIRQAAADQCGAMKEQGQVQTEKAREET